MPIGLPSGSGRYLPAVVGSSLPTVASNAGDWVRGNPTTASYIRNQLALGPGAVPVTNAIPTTLAGEGAGAIPGAVTPIAGAGGAIEGAAGGAAANAGRLAFLAKQPLAFGRTFAPSQFAGMPAGLQPGSLGRAGVYGIGGQLASGALRGVLGGEKDGNWDNFAEDALSYGGAGAGIGSMIFPGVGTAIGGGLGVGAAAVKDFLLGGGHDSPVAEARKEVEHQDKQLNAILAAAGLSPEATNQIRLQLAASNTGVTDKKAIQSAYQDVRTSIPMLAQQEQQQRQQLSGMLAAQQMLAPQFDGFLQNLGADQKAFAGANQSFADELSKTNPAFGGYLNKAGARSVMSNDATAAAYKAQLNSQVAQSAYQIGAPQSITNSLMQQYG